MLSGPAPGDPRSPAALSEPPAVRAQVWKAAHRDGVVWVEGDLSPFTQAFLSGIEEGPWCSLKPTPWLLDLRGSCQLRVAGVRVYSCTLLDHAASCGHHNSWGPSHPSLAWQPAGHPTLASSPQWGPLTLAAGCPFPRGPTSSR